MPLATAVTAAASPGGCATSRMSASRTRGKTIAAGLGENPSISGLFGPPGAFLNRRRPARPGSSTNRLTPTAGPALLSGVLATGGPADLLEVTRREPFQLTQGTVDDAVAV